VALTTKIIDGDLLMLRIMFPDGMMATVTAGRNSESITVAPNDREIAERLSSIFHWSADKVGEPGYPFTSLNQVVYGMETLARSAMSMEHFIEGLREVLEGHRQLNAFTCLPRCLGLERATHFQELRPVAK
jgi:hypothetical protein